MRLFVGFKLSHESLTAINQVPKPQFKIAWTRPENLHVTVRFLGETAPEHVAAVSACLRDVSQSHSAFKIWAGGAGAFPNARRARVFWIGIKEESGTLISLASAIEKAAVQLGYQPEKKSYFAHLTIARDKLGRQAEPILNPYNNKDFGVSLVDRFVLFESVSGPLGVQYKVLEEFALKIVD